MAELTSDRPGVLRPCRWMNGSPPALSSLLMVLLLGTATASFLVQEKGVAGAFGPPLDSGWHDLTLGRSLLSGIGEPLPYATESPGYAVVLGVLFAGGGSDTCRSITSLRLLNHRGLPSLRPGTWC